MTIAIVGGAGFLGNAIARALVAQGATVVQMARGQMTTDAVPGARFATADRSDQAALTAIFQREAVTCVIDVMTLTRDSTVPLLAAISAVGARYVMISAIDVYANYGGLARMEQPAVITRPLREEDPRRSVLYPYRQVARKPAGIDPILLRDYDKIPIEDLARADPALDSLILRLPAIYGPGDRQGRFTWITALLRKGGPLVIDARAAGWAQSYVYIDDAADAVARAALSGVASDTFNIATDTVRTMGDWAERFAQVAGTDTTLRLAKPDEGATLSDRAEATDMTYPLTLDGTRFAARFGAVARTPEDAAIVATIAWDAEKTA